MIKRLFAKVKANKIPKAVRKSLRLKHIDPLALETVRKLQKNGYQAYIVGGGVRDQLMGLHPKDFDVATNATPEEVKATFKNCRIIGRRFKLAHIFQRRHIIEVATFRGDHNDSHDQNIASKRDGIITRDNVYGTIEDDAKRRDFTINALFYDPVGREVIDFCGGLKDIEKKTIRMIGDPAKRFKEDPVRILRAIRIGNKLGFSLEPSLAKAIKPTLNGLNLISPARRFDEYIKLMLHGHGHTNFTSLRKHDALPYLFPSTDERMDDANTKNLVNQALNNTDERYHDGKSINPAFLISVLLWHDVVYHQERYRKQKLPPSDALHKAMGKVLQQQSAFTTLPKRFTATIRDIWTMQARLERRRPKQIMALLSHPRFRAAYDFMLLRISIKEVPEETGNWWTKIQTVNRDHRASMIKSLSSRPKKA